MRAACRPALFTAVLLSFLTLLPLPSFSQELGRPHDMGRSFHDNADEAGRHDDSRRDNSHVTEAESLGRETDLSKRNNAEFHDLDKLKAESDEGRKSETHPAAEEASHDKDAARRSDAEARDLDRLEAEVKAQNHEAEHPEAKSENLTTDSNRLTVSHDGYSTKVMVDGHPDSMARIIKTNHGIEVTDIYKRDLPSGTGSDMLAEGLKDVGLHSGDEFKITNIINPETKAAHENGVAASDSLLGKTATHALEKMGMEPSKIEYEMERDKLNLVIGVK